MGDKIPTKEAYKEIKDEVRKLKKAKKQIRHEAIAAANAARTTNIVQLDWDEKLCDIWHLVWTGNQWALRSTEWEQVLMIVFDLETDGLRHAVTKTHCIVC